MAFFRAAIGLDWFGRARRFIRKDNDLLQPQASDQLDLLLAFDEEAGKQKRVILPAERELDVIADLQSVDGDFYSGHAVRVHKKRAVLLGAADWMREKQRPEHNCDFAIG